MGSGVHQSYLVEVGTLILTDFFCSGFFSEKSSLILLLLFCLSEPSFSSARAESFGAPGLDLVLMLMASGEGLVSLS